MIPTVFVHGFLGSPPAWDEVLRALAPREEAIALALPGHGPEPWIPGVSALAKTDRSLRGRATCTTWNGAIDAIAARLPARAHLVGYSMGARVSLGLAARHPSRVASLVMVGLNPGLADDTERRARRAWDEEIARDLENEDLASFVSSWEALPLFATQTSLPADVRARRHDERMHHHPAALAWAQRTLGLGEMPDLWDALAALSIPVHLVTGARDDKFSQIARRVLARARACLHTAVDGAGHDVGLEAPRALAAILRSSRQESFERTSSERANEGSRDTTKT